MRKVVKNATASLFLVPKLPLGSKQCFIRAIYSILLFLISISSVAQQPAFSFQAKLSLDSIIIGDQVELTIQASLPKDYNIQFPFFADTLVTGIEVLGQPIIDTLTKRTGEREFTYRLKLTSFDEGYYRIPRFKLPFSDGEKVDTAQTSPIWFMVNTLPPDSTIANIYDIKMPLSEPITFAEVAPWVGGGILIVGLIALLVLFLIKRKNGEPIFFPSKPADPPHIVALRELGMIKDKKLWATENHKHYHTILIDVIRNYLEGRFSIQAMEQTTYEIISSLKNCDSINPKLLEELQKTLSLADLVKFAKFTPEIYENETSLNFGFRFVNETKIEVIEEENLEESDSSNQGVKIDVKPKALSVEPLKSNEL